MEKKITLSKKYGRWDDKSAFVIADNENLNIEISSIIPKGITCYITIFNGTKKKKIKYSGAFDVPDELIFIGQLLLHIDFMKDSDIYEQFSVEPLIIKQVDNDYEAIPEIAELENTITEQVNKFTDEIDTLIAYCAVLADVDKSDLESKIKGE